MFGLELKLRPPTAPAPDPQRDHWLTEQIANYKQAAYNLTDPANVTVGGARTCPRCEVGWAGSETCWSCADAMPIPAFPEVTRADRT